MSNQKILDNNQTQSLPQYSTSVVLKEGRFCPHSHLKGHLAISGDIFGCHISGNATGI